MKQFFAISLALLILVTNTSMTFTRHYCGGKMVKSSFGFGQNDLDCGMHKKNSKTCHHKKSKNNDSKKGCCQNKHTTISLDDDYSIPDAVKSTINFKFIFALAFTYIDNYFFLLENKHPFTVYSPPSYEQDRSILFQVFRI